MSYLSYTFADNRAYARLKHPHQLVIHKNKETAVSLSYNCKIRPHFAIKYTPFSSHLVAFYTVIGGLLSNTIFSLLMIRGLADLFSKL